MRGAKRKLGCHKKAVKKDWIERIAVNTPCSGFYKTSWSLKSRTS